MNFISLRENFQISSEFSEQKNYSLIKTELMDNDFAKHEVDYIREYEKLGFTDSYRFINNSLKSSESEKYYDPKEITIVKEHRYEGMSNPSDTSILYIIKTADGGKGTLLAGYGPKANFDLFEFIKKIPKDNIKDEKLLPPDAKK